MGTGVKVSKIDIFYPFWTLTGSLAFLLCFSFENVCFSKSLLYYLYNATQHAIVADQPAGFICAYRLESHPTANTTRTIKIELYFVFHYYLFKISVSQDLFFYRKDSSYDILKQIVKYIVFHLRLVSKLKRLLALIKSLLAVS